MILLRTRIPTPRLQRFLLFLALLYLAPAQIFADETAWEQYMDAGRAAYKQGDYQGAVRHFEAALKETNTFKSRGTGAGSAVAWLGFVYEAQDRFAEAEPLFQRALTIYENALGSEHPYVATTLDNLARLYKTQGRYAEAEPLYKRALAIHEQTLGPDHPDVAVSLKKLAVIYKLQNRYPEAEHLYQRVLAIREQSLGPGDLSMADSLNDLAALYQEQGRGSEAEHLCQRALTIIEQALGPDHPEMATSLNILAVLYADQGRYIEAESLYKRALVIREQTMGIDHPYVAVILNNLATLYISQGRFAEAEPLCQRALKIHEKTLGSGHLQVANSLNTLAEVYRSQGRYAEAEPLYKRALKIDEKALGSQHPDVALILNNLAALYDSQGRYAEAESLYKHALKIYEKVLGSQHPDVALTLNNLAALYYSQGNYALTGTLMKYTLAIQENALRPDHPHVANSLSNLAKLYQDKGQHNEALGYARRATTIHRTRAGQTADNRSIGPTRERQGVRFLFTHHVSLLHQLANGETPERSALTAESFEVGQLATNTGAAQAVSRMAARFGVGDDRLASLVRERQDTLDRWQHLDADLVKRVSLPPDKRDKVSEQRLRDELKFLDKRLDELDATLAREFPEYAELANPKPVPQDESQSLLGPDEALLAYLVDDEESYLWLVRQNHLSMHYLKIGKEELDNKVQRLRRSLNPSNVQTLRDIRPFDFKEAFELYRRLVLPAEPYLKDVSHLLLVPDGALQSLPFGVLVTRESQRGAHGDLGAYKEVPWLAKQYAVTTLPSVGSLRALRKFAKSSPAPDPFTGFGDPILDGEEGATKGINFADLFSRGSIANVGEVRALPRLPETAGELKALSKSLGGKDDDIYLQNRATERQVKRMNLTPFRTIAFSTHGLMAGDFKDVAEPALVLTPPKEGTKEDDGLLTASEVAQLKLNADWVILSACNTAAPDGSPGAQGLSGLARAFFYAGSRALLVSHWAISSDATVALTTRMFSELKDNPKLGRSEALRRSMQALMNNKDKPYYAHPMFWAPFVVVGEGRS